VQAFNRWHSEKEWWVSSVQENWFESSPIDLTLSWRVNSRRNWIAEGEKRNSYVPSRPDEYYADTGDWVSWVSIAEWFRAFFSGISDPSNF
jgi:hypothetical protein